MNTTDTPAGPGPLGPGDPGRQSPGQQGPREQAPEPTGYQPTGAGPGQPGGAYGPGPGALGARPGAGAYRPGGSGGPGPEGASGARAAHGPGPGAPGGYGPGAPGGYGPGAPGGYGPGAPGGYGPGAPGGYGPGAPGGYGPGGSGPGGPGGYGPGPYGAGAYGPGPGRPVASGFFDSLRRSGIWRGQDRWIGGVAAGVARRLDVDPLLIRGVLVVMTLFGGLGLLLYGVAWALLPEESDGRIHLQEALRGNVDAALAGAIAFTVIGLSRPGVWWGGWVSWGDGFFWSIVSVATVVLIVVGIVALARRGSRRTPPPPRGQWAGPGPDVAGGAPARGWQEAAGAPASHASSAGSFPPEGAAFGAAAAAAAGEPRPAGPGRSPRPAAPGVDPAAGQSWRETGGPVWQPAPPQTGFAGYGPVGAPPVPPRPAVPAPPPPRPAVPGPGQAVVAVVLALCLLAVAALLLVDRIDPIGWQLPLLIGGTVLGLLGLGVLVSGARGRRGGALSVLGVLLALLVVPATMATTIVPGSFRVGPGAPVGDLSVAPASPDEAARGYDLAAGDLDLDLRELSAGEDQVTIPVDVGAGDITIRVPDGAAVRVDAEVGAGAVETRTGPGWTDGEGFGSTGDSGTGETRSWHNGLGIDTSLSSPEARDGDPDVVVDVHVGAGRVNVVESPADDAGTTALQTEPTVVVGPGITAYDEEQR
ncbi:PspC domain-containing protein [Georgenia sp. AZ-5]|uniref:PspC domain-containing protein n=1 Tax=Georgenia sp. AZ-5 TaxID=3367526 RepID=UPI003754E45C